MRITRCGLPGMALAVTLAAGMPARAAPDPKEPKPEPVLSGCEIDYPPYCIVTPDQRADGFSVELLRAALKAMGREVTFKTGPWSEIKQDLAEGRLQALPLVGRTPEREALYDFTFPYLTMHGTIVVRENNPAIHTVADLQGREVAVLQGDNAEEYLRRANLGAVIVTRPSFEVALRELAAGQHDAVVIQKLLAFQLMNDAHLGNLMTVGPPLNDFTQSFCFAARKGDSGLLSALNEGLSIVMADGTFRALYAKWFAGLQAMDRVKSRIVIGGDRNFPPYEFLDKNGQPTGFCVDLTRALARQMGMSVEIRLGIWNDIRKDLPAGTIDAVEGMYYSRARDKVFDFTPPHTMVQQVIVVRAGTPGISTMKDLAGKSVLVQAGDLMEDLAVEQGLAKQLVPVRSQEEALRLLAAGEHDCALVARVPALYWIHQHGWHNLRVVNRPVFAAEYCFAVPAGSKQVLAQLTEGLAALKATGEYRKIQTRWLGPYEQSKLDFWTVATWGLVVAVPLLALLGGVYIWNRTLRREVARQTRQQSVEITERKQAEKTLRASEKKFRTLTELSPVGIFLDDAQGKGIYINECCAELVGLPAEQALSLDRVLSIHPDDRERVTSRWSETVKNGTTFSEDYRWVHPDGEVVWTHGEIAPVRDQQDNVEIFIGVLINITDRKVAQADLQASLREKEALLKEVHHRVKNNLQVISSLLRLEAGKSNSPATKEVMGEMQGRIRSMALLHETLYRTENFAAVSLGDYLQALAAQLFKALNTAPHRVKLDLEFSPGLMVDIDQAIPCGLIVNELLTNALKHGFPEPHTGRVELSLRSLADQAFELVVRDTGVGLPKDFDIGQSKTLGLQLVTDLTRQLQGRLDVGPGAVFKLVFKTSVVEP